MLQGRRGHSDASLEECELLCVSSIVVCCDSSEWVSICAVSIVASIGLGPAKVVAEVAVILVSVDAGAEGWRRKWQSFALLHELLAECWDLHVVSDLLDADVVVVRGVVGVH